MMMERVKDPQVLSFHTVNTPVDEQLKRWGQCLSRSEGVKIVSDEDRFVGSIRKLVWDDFVLSYLNFETPHTVIRSARSDLCVVNINTRLGSGVYRGSREYAMTPGEVILHNTSDNCELDYRSHGSVLALTMPYTRIEPYVENFQSLFDRPLVCNRQITSLLVRQCKRILNADFSISTTVQSYLVTSLMDLLGATLQDAGEKLPQASTWGQKALLQRIKCHIREHLDQPDLSPSRVATAMGISVGYLHRLFHLEDSSAMRFIMTERLERARDRLRRARSDESIGQTAFACGFNDASHFARVFKERFGVSPREYKSRFLTSH